MTAMVHEGDWLWTPDEARVRRSRLSAYLSWLARERGQVLGGYGELWRWSVEQPDAFWRSIWQWCEVLHDGSAERVTDGAAMPHTRWFPDARVNYAEHVLRHAVDADPEHVAFHHASELEPVRALPLRELASQVRRLARWLRAQGVGPGDRVVAYLPNVPACAVAMLAATSIGAVWSAAAVEFGVGTVVDRFRQIEPKVLIAADGYRFGGKPYDRRDEVARIVAALPSLQALLWVPTLDGPAPAVDGVAQHAWDDALAGPEVAPQDFRFERVASGHPLWVVFSSGTTGLPKPIVHSHVGVLVEHLKLMHLHIDLRPGSSMFFYSTTGWMMWNLLVAALMTGASSVLYDGSPLHDGPECLWRLAEATGASCFGASPTFVQIMEKAGLQPGRSFDLSALDTIVLSGAPCTPETFAWFHEAVKRDLWVTSQSGGTEICSGFVGSAPTQPVYAGEIQARMLGMAVEVWDEQGRPVVDQVGELVVLKPCPSMPIAFWNDRDGALYREAYFEQFPGVWRHGDFMKINQRGGCYIYGRSDSTLNRHGVRIGAAEIYRVVESVPEVADSLVVGCELPGGGFYMPLFVKLRAGVELDDALRGRVAEALRRQCSPRHVPDVMLRVREIPYTLTGKKMEIPVRRILMGTAPERAANRDAMANPQALDEYLELARSRADVRAPPA